MAEKRDEYGHIWRAAANADWRVCSRCLERSTNEGAHKTCEAFAEYPMKQSAT